MDALIHSWVLDPIRENAVVIVVVLMFYSAWRLEQIARRIEAVRFMMAHRFNKELDSE
jgi:hypothetical protein